MSFGVALACSGPGAAEAIANADLLGIVLFLLALVAVVALQFTRRLRERGWPFRVALVALVVLHPGWWMSARSGDCGRMLTLSSIAMTVVGAGVVAWAFFGGRRTPRAEQGG